ncbi:hypothetical protein BJX66DRAFT_345343 [Aspergillus keveii]|uniref:SnoaL-like domain-containing protein n=1 Tax=Aspergillus keveii TaxID=714993 RepID=A0ABR4FID1_9EURO
MTLLDELAIQTLILRERFARDTGQWAKLRDAYHPDASRTRIRTMWHDGDIDGFVSGSKKLHTSSGAVIHQVVPAEFEIKGWKAVADCWCFITARLEMNQHDYELKTSLRLLYRCEKVKGEWKLISLEPIYIHDLLAPVPPAPSLELPCLEGLRKSYKFTAWMVQQRGITVANDLPGEDVPKECGGYTTQAFRVAQRPIKCSQSYSTNSAIDQIQSKLVQDYSIPGTSSR